MRVIFIRYLDLTEINALVEANVIPSIAQDMEIIIGSCSYPDCAFLHLIRDEESKVEFLFILECALTLALGHGLGLMEGEELRVQDLAIIVNYDPEGLALSIPPIIPLEISPNGQMHLEDSTCKREHIYLDIKVRDI